MIQITLPDGTIKQVNKGTSAMHIAKDISEGLARNVLLFWWTMKSGMLTAHWNHCRLTLLTWSDPLETNNVAFSAHLLAEALEALYPGIKLV